ncbi:hypothetical protein RchiOBHm_Chr4g0402831 [Rosa chinensis]|uniref:Uncharacterized protein n=1 Tax=Rosa chinensis TaxID=74649 RepID=A0A2P6QTF1_ROSCH|nr:hypothetical protein RchiOBHm_Chr4g0402831 [Rosa chinensis]
MYFHVDVCVCWKILMVLIIIFPFFSICDSYGQGYTAATSARTRNFRMREKGCILRSI